MDIFEAAPSEGWPIAAAIDNCVHPKVFPRERVFGLSAEEAEPIRQAFLEPLHRLLTSGHLVGQTRCGDTTAAAAIVPAAAWKTIRLCGVNNSRAVDTQSGATHFDVRVFPVLESPCALDRLNGMLLRDAFLKFVVHDPQVQAQGYYAVQRDPSFASVFREGRNRTDGGYWPMLALDHSAEGEREAETDQAADDGLVPQEVRDAIGELSHRWRDRRVWAPSTTT